MSNLNKNGFGKLARVSALAFAAVLLLSGCSSFNGIFGGEESVALDGERKAVLKKKGAISIDLQSNEAPVAVPAAVTNRDWAQPGGSPSNAPQHVALGTSLKRAWRSSAGQGSSSQGRLTASPIAVGNRVFTLDTEATVYAFDASSGKRLWRAELTPEEEEEEEGYGGGVASENGKVFAAIGFGYVVALNPADGKVLWSKSIGVPIRSAPTAAGGRVYVTTVNNEVFALSQTDGEVVWKYAGVAETAGLLSSTSPAVSEGKVVVPYTSGEIVAFDSTEGFPVWSDTLTRAGGLSSLANINDIAGRPVIDRGTVFAISHSGRMLAVSLDSGERVWEQNISGTQTPWAAGNYVFVITQRGVLMALSRKTGGVRWVLELDTNNEWSGPVLAGGRLLMVSSSGLFVSASPETGQVIEKIELGEKILISPIVAGSTVYLMTDDADLIAMR